METKKGKAIIGIAMAAIMIASVMVAMVPTVSAQAGIERLKVINFFLFLGYITLGLSVLLLIFAFAQLVIKKRVKRSRIEELIRMIKEVKELKSKIEERGENLSSLSDVFLTQISILSEINSMKTLVLFGLEVLVALSLAIISMLFIIISMV